MSITGKNASVCDRVSFLQLTPPSASAEKLPEKNFSVAKNIVHIVSYSPNVEKVFDQKASEAPLRGRRPHPLVAAAEPPPPPSETILTYLPLYRRPDSLQYADRLTVYCASDVSSSQSALQHTTRTGTGRRMTCVSIEGKSRNRTRRGTATTIGQGWQVRRRVWSTVDGLWMAACCAVLAGRTVIRILFRRSTVQRALLSIGCACVLGERRGRRAQVRSEKPSAVLFPSSTSKAAATAACCLDSLPVEDRAHTNVFFQFQSV